MDKVEYEVASFKYLKNIDLNLSRIATMFNEFLLQEYGIEYSFYDDDETELPNLTPFSDGDTDDE